MYLYFNYRKMRTESFCQENLFTFFKCHVDSVLMSQHYYWTQLENHLCLRMSLMAQWSELDGNFYSCGESKQDHEKSIDIPVTATWYYQLK